MGLNFPLTKISLLRRGSSLFKSFEVQISSFLSWVRKILLSWGSQRGLSNADLTGADLSGASLTGANLTGANIDDADLDNFSQDKV